jgi:RNA-directed DNA polymerase
LRSLLALRVRDGVLLRLIGKWLNAGVLEDGALTYPDEGTPQGGVLSPLLANIYLHYVLDEWFEQEVKSRLRGRAFLIRYADDFVIGFACEEDARRVLEVLPKRFGKYGLTIHPDKTRLVPFGSPERSERETSGPDSRPGTFDFLGFTHYWGTSRKGNAVIKRQTSTSRFSRAVKKIADWCRRHRHWPIPEQHATLSQKLRGHYGYYGITGNSRALANLRYVVTGLWHKWLSRRSWAGYLSWPRFARLQALYALPPPIVVHSVYRQAAKL